jgi:hypothetical protein
MKLITGVLLLLTFLSTSANAISINVPKGLIDVGLAKKFPREKLTISLDKPTTRFSKERQKIELCGTWANKISKQNGDFCIDFQPVWSKAKGDIEITKVNLLKLTTSDGNELPASFSAALNSTVLTLLDGTSVYHAPEMVGKVLERIEVQESSIRLVF